MSNDKKTIQFPSQKPANIDELIKSTGTEIPAPSTPAPNQEVIDMFQSITFNPAYVAAISLATDNQGGLMLNLTSHYQGSPHAMWMALGQLDQAKAILLSVLQSMARNPGAPANPPPEGGQEIV